MFLAYMESNLKSPTLIFYHNENMPRQYMNNSDNHNNITHVHYINIRNSSTMQIWKTTRIIVVRAQAYIHLLITSWYESTNHIGFYCNHLKSFTIYTWFPQLTKNRSSNQLSSHKLNPTQAFFQAHIQLIKTMGYNTTSTKQEL